MRVLVVGGGIGGLTAALSLHEAGLDVTVLESVAEVKPLGVGINLLPHAVRELAELGLLPALDAIGVRTAELAYYSKHGARIWTEKRGLDAGYDWPQFSIHRGRLQMLLHEVALARLGPERVRAGRHCLGVEQPGGGAVIARFSDRRDGEELERLEADVVIAADGIHSTIRRQFHPGEGLPRWSGAILWRATSMAAPYLTGRSMIMAGHERQKFVCYPISNTPDAAGRIETNWIAELKIAEAGTPPPAKEDWNKAGRLDSFLPEFESWRFDWLDVPALIRAANSVWEFPMVDRDPLDSWTHGRVTLLGDAAHPMYPIGSNGASQAIVDARVLAWNLATAGDIDAALAAYDADRRPKTGAIVLANRGQGPEQVMQMVEDRAPDGFERLHDVISQAELEEVAARYKRLAGFDPALLNQRASYSVSAAA